jgi:phospholipid/cholesterol/gamma-HCH transport system permease protein
MWYRYSDSATAIMLRSFGTMRELMAFAMITLGVMVTKRKVARQVIRPLVAEHIARAGLRLLPMIGFLAVALGLVIIGQTVALLTKVGAQDYIGTVMVTVLVRELGPLLTALVVLARSGTSNVVELGTARALGEVESLESLGIDPIHYLVVPRVIGLGLSVFCLSTYLVLVTIASGYVFVFLQDVPITLGAYVGQLADALRWQDFLLLALKTGVFGAVIAIVNCYHGLARPLHIDQVSEVTTRAVVECLVACVLVDAMFLVGYIFV